MKNQIITSLTFQDNNAENAMNFYVELFKNSQIIRVKRWEKGGPVEEGRIMQATFELDGNLFMLAIAHQLTIGVSLLPFPTASNAKMKANLKNYLRNYQKMEMLQCH